MLTTQATSSLLLFVVFAGFIITAPTSTFTPTTHASTIKTTNTTTATNSTKKTSKSKFDSHHVNFLEDKEIPLDLTETVQFALALLIMVVAVTALGMLYFLYPDGWDIASVIDDDNNEGQSCRKEDNDKRTEAVSRKKSPEKKSVASTSKAKSSVGTAIPSMKTSIMATLAAKSSIVKGSSKANPSSKVTSERVKSKK